MSNTSESNIDGWRVGNLRCEYLVDPLGIDDPAPRLSWKLASQRNGARQASYRVIAGGWDSGRVESAAMTVEYAGPPLGSRDRVDWRVQVWDDGGVEAQSGNATFEMALLTPSDWTAAWIGADDDIRGEDTPTPWLQKTFTLPAAVTRARLYITALGIYEAHCNGSRIGDDRFTPGWTDYHHRLQYQTYDVTSLLRAGNNVLDVELADGWYAGYVGFLGREIYGVAPELLAQLEATLDDGTTAVIASGDDWLVGRNGRVTDLLMGETFDARHELADWQPARRTAGTTARLVAPTAPPTRATMELPAVAASEYSPGRWIVDVGQNISGWLRLRVRGDAGTAITLRFAEVLDADGALYTDNLRAARATDRFVLAGGDTDEVLEPAFTFHGFRYVEITGYPDPLSVENVTAVVCTADLEETGGFQCDDPAVNQLQSNIVWGQRGNFLEVPTDCPQRDERLGWTGDAQVFAPTACFNMDVASFLSRWTVDLVEGQADDGGFPVVVPRLSGPNPHENDGAPGWGDAGVIVPWTLYVRYGDRRLLARCFDAMVRWIDHIQTANPDLLWKHGRHGDMGDWLSIDADSPKEVLGSSFFTYSADLVARAAAALDRGDADVHRARANHIRAAYNAAYVKDDGSIEGDTQTVYALALRFGLLDDDAAVRAAKRLAADVEGRGYHLSTGFLGVAHLLPALSDAGYVDAAYRLLHQDTYPSWGYPIRHGATTIWERWDGWTEEHGFQDPAMNSFNHYAFGAVGEWLYESVAGIRPVEAAPGYERAVIAPRPGGRLRSVYATYRSVRGPIAVKWKREDTRFVLDVSLSPGCTAAEIRVPSDAGDEIYAVGSGEHHYETTLTA